MKRSVLATDFSERPYIQMPHFHYNYSNVSYCHRQWLLFLTPPPNTLLRLVTPLATVLEVVRDVQHRQDHAGRIREYLIEQAGPFRVITANCW